VGVGLCVFAGLVGPRYFEMSDTGALDQLRLAAVIVALIGYAWMIRIAFRDPEAGPSPWRYRAD
jgi:hypothetical protein